MTQLKRSYKELNTLYPAFSVFFDAVDGAMEVWAHLSMEAAATHAEVSQLTLEAMGHDDCGHYRALAKLPRKSVYKFHAPAEGPKQ